MSVYNFSRHPCPVCQSDVFSVYWDDDELLGKVKHLKCDNCGYDWPELTPAQVAIQEQEDEEAEAFRQRELAEYHRSCLMQLEPALFRPFNVERIYSTGGSTTLASCVTLEDARRFLDSYIEGGWFQPGQRWAITQLHEHYDDQKMCVVSDFTGEYRRTVAEGVVE